LGGFAASLCWLLAGLLWSITIVGLPLGTQCFKFARLSAFPFGKEIVFGGGAPSLIMNILWLLFGGFEMALGHAAAGLVFCVTIIGIPFGKQHFKLAKLALLPFGASVV
jgi:uncharacterized membrane protein YccF (DUF307 family)